MIYESIRARLLASEAITTAVGDRVHKMRAPGGSETRPYILMQQISRVPVVTLTGDVGTYFARYQITLIHDDPHKNEQLAADVRAQLSGWQQVAEDEVIRMDLINEIDNLDDLAGQNAGVNRIIQDYECNFVD